MRRRHRGVMMDRPFAAVCADPVLDSAEAGSAGQLEELLRGIAARCDRPVMASVRRRDGDVLCIGLGRPYSVLTYVPGDDNPPYFTSVGNLAPDEAAWFDYHGQPSEFGRH